MPTIAEHLGVNPNRITFEEHEDLPKGSAVGIEIELENITGGRWPQQIDGWVRKDDGSLRNGKEYIFDGPQSGQQCIDSIEAMSERMGAVGVTPNFRCSTHIHLDVRDLSWDKYERVVLLYMAYEDVFYDHCDPIRRHSNFCVPFQSNDWLAYSFGRQVIGQELPSRKFAGVQRWPKYSGLNLQSTTSFGSIEFRGSHAMYTASDLLALTQRMMHLKRYVLEDTSEDHYAFLEKVTTSELSDVFPTGLRQGYAMEDGAKEQGISSAYYSLVVSQQQDPRHVLERAPVPPLGELVANHTTLLATALSATGRWNTRLMLDFSIQTQTRTPTLGGAIKLMNALNSLYGVNVALSDVLLDVPDQAVQVLARHFQTFKDMFPNIARDMQVRHLA